MFSGQPENRRPPSADEKQRLFILIGQAVWCVQHLEDALSRSIALKIDLKDAAPGSVPRDKADSILLKRRRMTLGHAVNCTSKSAVYGRQIQNKLESFRKERDWLVHHLLYKGGEDMNIDEKREALFERISQVILDAVELQKLLRDDLEDFAVRKGMRRETIHSVAQREFLKDRGLL